jgi:hypothetical protein
MTFSAMKGMMKMKGRKRNKPNTHFVFGESKNLDADTLAFYNREAMVDAASFAETIRNLKALVLRG